MRILMLGWEFSPWISGGLGTACRGIATALGEAGHRVIFVMPRPVAPGGEALPPRVRARGPAEPVAGVRRERPGTASAPESWAPATGPIENVRFRVGPAGPVSVAGASVYGSAGPYGSAGFASAVCAGYGAGAGGAGMGGQEMGAAPNGAAGTADECRRGAGGGGEKRGHGTGGGPEIDYGADIVDQAHRYAEYCAEVASGEAFDVIHAHDWMSFPAGIAAAGATGRPLVAHVHSTEYDRGGERPDSRILEMERRGVHAAARVLAVSELTRRVLLERYGADPARVRVVYNGSTCGAARPGAGGRAGGRGGAGDERVVLFLGRITRQKGPEYFAAAARRVLAERSDVRFVVAGAGDRLEAMTAWVEAEGLGERFHFTGFLDGEAVDATLRRADVLVMPSVSEPFGLAALEAAQRDVPVIVSKNSGVAEVLENVFKVDVADTDAIADRILGLLRHPRLSRSLGARAGREAAALTWDRTAEGCTRVYREVIAEAGGAPAETAERRMEGAS